jgi:Uma2 family endonuclease
MSTPPKSYITPEEYLEIDRKAEFKSEYFAGEMFAMAGAREQHNLIVGNAFAGLHQQMRKRPCRAYTNDMRVQISATGLYVFPDVIGVCGEPRFLDERRETLLNPNLIVEVLSESSEAYDRGKKFEHYRTLESFTEYLMLSSDHVSAELFTRQPDGRWILSTASGIQESIDLPSVGCRLTLADVYEKVDLTTVRVGAMRPLER